MKITFNLGDLLVYLATNSILYITKIEIDETDNIEYGWIQLTDLQKDNHITHEIHNFRNYISRNMYKHYPVKVAVE